MLRRTFASVINALQDKNYPYSNRAWIEQALYKYEWIGRVCDEEMVQAALLTDLIHSTDSTLTEIRSKYGNSIADQVGYLLIEISKANQEDKLELLERLQQGEERLINTKLIIIITDVDNYVNVDNAYAAIEYLDDKLRMVEALQRGYPSIYQKAKESILRKKATYRLSRILS